MSKKKRKQKERRLAEAEHLLTDPAIDWKDLKPFTASGARKWAEKHAGKVVRVGGRTITIGGVYTENGKLYFWVEPCDSHRSWFRIDSKIARYLRNSYWEEV